MLRASIKLLSITLLFALFIGCQTVDETPIEEQTSVQRRVVTAQSIPGVISTLQLELGLPNHVSQFSTAGGGVESTLQINWDQILQLINEAGEETYTFAVLDNNNDPFTFYNLILQFNSDQQAHQPYLLRYEMSDEFIPVYQQTRSLENFSGTVTKILLSAGSSTNTQNTAALNLDGSLVGTTCPNGTINFSGGVGGWTGVLNPGTNPGILEPDPVKKVTCTKYLNYTVWYSQTCDASGNNCSDPEVTDIVFGSIVTECTEGSSGSTSSDSNGDCVPSSGEVPILDVNDLKANLWEQEVCEKEAFANHTCLQEIWTKMKEKNVGFEAISRFTGDDPLAKLCFDVKKLGSANGNTQPTGTLSNMNVTININSDKLYRSKLSVARTMIHELFHAELFAFLIQAGWYGELEQYAANYQGDDPFMAIWEYYQEYGKYKPGVNAGWQHEYMADTYIMAIASSLKELAPELLTSRFVEYIDSNDLYTLQGEPMDWNWDELYTAMAWEGLKKTDQYKDGLSEADKNKYDNYVRMLNEAEVLDGKCN